jgi:hypothetical protein
MYHRMNTNGPLTLRVKQSLFAATILVLGGAFPGKILAGTFSGIWTGTLSPGYSFSLEINGNDDGAILTAGALPSETLLFVGQNPYLQAVNFYRTADHAAISIYAAGGGFQYSYMEEGYLRTAALTYLAPSSSSIGPGPTPVPTLSNRFVGTWPGVLQPWSNSVSVTVLPGSMSGSFTGGATTDSIEYLGYNEAAQSIYFWRPYDSAFVNLYDVNGETAIAYLEEGFLRTTHQRSSVPDSGTSVAVLAVLWGSLLLLRRRFASQATSR